MTLTDVANSIGINRATTRRFLLTLVDLGYVETDGKHYRLTPKVMTLGYSYLSSLPWWELARPLLEEVSRTLQESASIGVLSGDQLIWLARVRGPRLLGTNLSPGRPVTVHATGIGRVLLAELSDEEQDRFIANTRLEALTPMTVTDPGELKKALQITRQQGYAIIDQELEAGLRAVAVPIRDRNGRAVAGFGVSTHVQRRSLEELEHEVLPLIREKVAKIRNMLPA